MREYPAKIRLLEERAILRVTSLERLPQEWRPDLRFLVSVENDDDLISFYRLLKNEISNIALLTHNSNVFESQDISSIKISADSLMRGDVISVLPCQQHIQVLIRDTDIHHTVFLTNRCNSNCLMCSQPPTRSDDSWLIEEAKRVADHISTSPITIGFTGGEPLLLDVRLREVLDYFSSLHPSTKFEVLTNGRRFSNPELASSILTNLQPQVSWMVPLYGHTDFIHDFVVQSPGAFWETIEGLLTLQSYAQQVQLRIVLIRPVLEILPSLCEFIGRNLPFVSEVALMGCEPTGFALANTDICQIDIADWSSTLEKAISWLERFDIPALLMNLPHCGIPCTLWPLANRSISDWKQISLSECTECECRKECSGMFKSIEETGWRPTTIRKIGRQIK